MYPEPTPPLPAYDRSFDRPELLTVLPNNKSAVQANVRALVGRNID